MSLEAALITAVATLWGSLGFFILMRLKACAEMEKLIVARVLHLEQKLGVKRNV